MRSGKEICNKTTEYLWRLNDQIRHLSGDCKIESIVLNEQAFYEFKHLIYDYYNSFRGADVELRDNKILIFGIEIKKGEK